MTEPIKPTINRYSQWCLLPHKHKMVLADNGAWVLFEDYKSVLLKKEEEIIKLKHFMMESADRLRVISNGVLLNKLKNV